jgi:hypothetical protein
VASVLSGVSNQTGNVNYGVLPCTLSGTTNATGGTTYLAKVVYQAQNSAGTLQTLTCSAGQGVTGITAGYHLNQAYITSCAPTSACPADPTQAISSSMARRTESTYQFKTTNANVAGGVITAQSGIECLVAAFTNGSTPAGGATLDTTTSCGSSSPYSSLEQFQYTPNWNLEIALSGINYCIQDPGTSSTIPLTTNCTGITSQWGVDDVADFEGVNSSNGPNNTCLDVNSLANTSSVTLVETPAIISGCGTPWQSAASVGSGGAAPVAPLTIGPTNQFVNYDEFGRCMDVTNTNVGWPYLIDYTCKQFPDTTNYPIWNQRWCFDPLVTTTGSPTVGIVYTPNNASPGSCGTPGTAPPVSPYCLTSPRATATASANNVVTVTSCTLPAPNSGTSGVAANLQWTTYGSLGTAQYQYTWQDASGYCLEANTANQLNAGNPALTQTKPANPVWSIIQVDTCNGSYQQKWNAPATLGNSQVVNTHEGTGTGTVTGP